MKAVIVDLLNGQAAALCGDGRVVKLADAGYTLGQIVEVREQKRRRPAWLRVISSVAAAAVLLMALSGGAAYAMPYGVVSLDVNPSIEYTINRFDYVLSVEGVNEDGKALLEGMDRSQLVHRRIGDALEASVAQLEAGQWLGGESDEILISAGTKTEAHSEKLLSELESGLRHGRSNLEVCALTVSREEIDEAHRVGMSAGRRRILQELSESEGESAIPEGWAERPIGDILRELEQGRTQGPDMDAQGRQTREREQDAQRREAQAAQNETRPPDMGAGPERAREGAQSGGAPQAEAGQPSPEPPEDSRPGFEPGAGFAPEGQAFAGGEGPGGFPEEKGAAPGEAPRR